MDGFIAFAMGNIQAGLQKKLRRSRETGNSDNGRKDVGLLGRKMVVSLLGKSYKQPGHTSLQNILLKDDFDSSITDDHI
jgi:hypothetical protein